jgi:hypothetical protein
MRVQNPFLAVCSLDVCDSSRAEKTLGDWAILISKNASWRLVIVQENFHEAGVVAVTGTNGFHKDHELISFRELMSDIGHIKYY